MNITRVFEVLEQQLAEYPRQDSLGAKVKGKWITYSTEEYARIANLVSYGLLEMGLKKGDKILIVDEWIETGTQMKASIKLIEELGGIIIGISTLCSHKNKQTQILFEKYNLKAIRIIDEI